MGHHTNITHCKSSGGSRGVSKVSNATPFDSQLTLNPMTASESRQSNSFSEHAQILGGGAAC